MAYDYSQHECRSNLHHCLSVLTDELTPGRGFTALTVADTPISNPYAWVQS